MRYSIYILLILFGFQPVLLSQNYQLIYSNRSALFELPNKSVVSYKVDSITFESDSVFHFTKHLKPDTNSYDCYTLSGNWWIGGTMSISGVYNIFTNKFNDSIRIKTDAKPGENWIVYEKTDSMIVVGVVTAQNNMNFLGITDSVKTIGFQVYDYLMNPLSSALNNMNIQISKHHGLIKTLNFNLFPCYFQDVYFVNPFYGYSLIELPLIGISNPDIGKQNLTQLKIFDFEINDELHIQMKYLSLGYMYRVRKQIIQFTGRINYTDSIQYSTHVKENVFTVLYSNFDTTDIYTEYDKNFTVKPDTIIDKLPAELLLDGLFANFLYTLNTPRMKKITDSEYFLTESGMNLFCYTNYDGCNFSQTYIEGLGGPYYYCEFFYVTLDTRELIYYKKGTETEGTPFSFTNINSFSAQKSVQIYPNPASDYLVITSEKNLFPLTLNLMDVHGRIVMKSIIDHSGETLSISHLPKGMYMYRLILNDELIQTGKFIIQ